MAVDGFVERSVTLEGSAPDGHDTLHCVRNLLGFDVDLVHNLVHLVTGIAGLAAAFTGWSRRFNQIFGIIYIIVGIAGLIPALYFDGRLLGLMHINAADNVLHLVVGVVAAAVGFFVAEDRVGTRTV